MNAFFDTSALVPLVIKEPHTASAQEAWRSASARLGWQWVQVEAEAALLRRSASPKAWAAWRTIESAVDWIEPDSGWLSSLRSFNRGLKLRAADAGHLYVMERCLDAVPDLQLIAFDEEMKQAASARGIAVWAN